MRKEAFISSVIVFFHWPLQLQLSHANVDLVAACDATTPRECGQQIGRQMALQIRTSVSSDVAKLEPFLGTEKGKQIFAALLLKNRKAYPDVASEYEGLAEGAGISSDDVFVSALAAELVHFARLHGFGAMSHTRSCTDYHVMDRVGVVRAWGHNEDEAPALLNQTYMVHATVAGFRYIGFAYAPHPVGWAWGFNSHGMAQSVNALAPVNVSIGIGVNFLARDVLNSQSLNDAISRACVAEVATGQNFNLGSIHDGSRQLLIETSPLGCNVREVRPSLERVHPTVAFHCNLYESDWLKGIDGGAPAQPSSAHRMARLRSLPPADSIKELQNVLSDAHDPLWPVHRNAKPPDTCSTLNTVIFDAAHASVAVWGPIASAEEPAMKLFNWTTFDEMRLTNIITGADSYTVLYG